MTDIIEELHYVAREVGGAFRSINSGGCGVMAAIFGRALAKFLDEEDIAISIDSWAKPEEDFATIRNRINETNARRNTQPSIRDWNGNGVGFNHVWVTFRLGDTLYSMDCCGVKEGEELEGWGEPLEEKMTLDDMVQLGFNPEGWNCYFEREQVPEIERMVEELFEQRIYPLIH